MTYCAGCFLQQTEKDASACLHVNRPGGIELTRAAIDLCALNEGANVLDIACGAGGTMELLVREYHLNAVGLDRSADMLQRGLSGQILPLVQADCAEIPLDRDSQDAVFMECAFSLAGDPLRTLLGVRRVLKPSGVLVLTDIYIREVQNPADVMVLSASDCLAGVMTEAGIRSWIAEAGFQVTAWLDQTPALKCWMAEKIIQLGSAREFFRLFLKQPSDSDGEGFPAGVKLGYYLLIATVV